MTCQKSGMIKMAHFAHSNAQSVISTDPIIDLFLDTGTNSICMSDLDGNLVTTIITDHLEEPRAIALHPSKG